MEYPQLDNQTILSVRQIALHARIMCRRMCRPIPRIALVSPLGTRGWGSTSRIPGHDKRTMVSLRYHRREQTFRLAGPELGRLHVGAHEVIQLLAGVGLT